MGVLRRRFVHSIALSACAGLPLVLASPAYAKGEWVTHPDHVKLAPVVLHFRREVALSSLPKNFPIKVSADNRFVLYVNGKRVAKGPSRGDLAHWRYQTVDIRPYLKRGDNVIAAEVWNTVTDSTDLLQRTSPFAQISATTGFWLEGANDAAQVIDSGPQWLVAEKAGHNFTFPLVALYQMLGDIWYAAGSGEVIDGATADWGWQGAQRSSAKWTAAVPALPNGAPSRWTLVPDTLPPMLYTPVKAGKVVRSDLPDGGRFPAQSVTVPANSEVSLLIDQGVQLSAYPALTVSQGKGAKITVVYAEALYDDQKHKGDRNAIAGRRAIGLEDIFLPDGGMRRAFAPLWWRTWRYMDIRVKTGAEPLTLNGLSVRETGYPFEQKAYFKSSDAQLDKIWAIGWQTQKINAHENYMDSSYWEQLQYVGDTRVQAEIVDVVSGDPRLTRVAIDAFGDSQSADGMIQSAYPSSTDNVIPTFGLMWIGMMHDYWMRQPDVAVVERNLSKAQKVLDWYAPHVAANGLLSRNPGWNFVDWVGDPPMAREAFPSFDPVSGTSCMTSLIYLGALREAADMEADFGQASAAAAHRAAADKMADAVRTHCWDAERGLFADDPSKTVFSQHTNALAVLYDVVPHEQMPAILNAITSGKGIDAPDGILTTSYYFAWYLGRAFVHAGMGDRYVDLLETWRDLDALNFTTWPEARGNTRSDSHAWSAHPTAGLITVVAGITPDAPGYAKVQIAPQPGGLQHFDTASMTPHGLVRVRYKAKGAGVQFTITLPKGLDGSFVWQGKSYPLKSGKQTFRF
jgi:alpha-L-rhamnosidase